MHTQKKAFETFENNEMNAQEMIAFLEHLDHCDFCLEQMIAHTEQAPAAQAPAYLKEQVLSKASSPDVQAVKAVSATSYKLQMLYYGLRTAICIITTLLFLFGTSQIDFTALHSGPGKQIENLESTNMRQEHKDHLYHFSQNLGSGLSDSSRKLAGFLTDLSNNIVNGGN